MTTCKQPQPPRPPQSQPVALPIDAPNPLPPLSITSLAWIPLVSLDINVHLDHFYAGLTHCANQPEQSSSTILRADTLFDSHDDHSTSLSTSTDDQRIPKLEGYALVRRVRRRILPSRPQFDGAVEQDCLYYQRTLPGRERDEENSTEGLVLLLPDVELLKSQGDEQYKSGTLPYYHPQVTALAFRFLPPALSAPSSASCSATLRIDLIPLPTPSSSPSTVPPPPPSPPKSLAPNDRLYRTALMLLKFSAKLCQGQRDGWQKRVNHDLLVGKEEVQDLYQELKERYKTDLAAFPSHSPSSDHPRITFRHLLQSWQLDTDPVKHVFEDVAIVAWLICVWRRIYSEVGGRPPGGFVDVGCGNGLLVHILHSEGYKGYGFDLRARKSWAHYSPSSPPDLRVLSLDPVSLLSTTYLSPSFPSSSSSSDEWPFPPSSFIIGNHADEMTPWMPLLAAATPGPYTAYLSIPCCLHELSGRFDKTNYVVPEEFLAELPRAPSENERVAEGEGEGTHPLLVPFYAPSPPPPASSSSTPPPSLTTSRYGSYQLYLAHLSLLCGFVPEREALRIPSTKNFGILGARRVWEGRPGGAGGEERGREERGKVRERVREVLEEVKRKGTWVARRPEGKAGEH